VARRTFFQIIGACAVLALPSSAQARIVRAEAVLPPGQSGFVSVPGVASGTGSPHLYDQQPLFIGFRRRSFMFAQPGGTETPKPGVRIVRDAWGVPQITGDTEVDAWWGAGYAVAQDRLFELELFRRATQGRLAEILGKDYLDDDLVARRDYYTPAELDDMYARMPAPLRARTEAYRDGVNAWIQHVSQDPADMPGEFAATGDLPIQPWTTRDSASIGVFLARTVPSGDGNELSNLRAVQEVGPGVLEALLPLRLPGQLSTIPASDGRFTQGRPRSAREERLALRRSLAFARTLPRPSPAMATAAARKAQLAPGRLGRVGGSSMFAVRGPGGRAWLFNGPQLGFAVPELFVELEVHAPGVDIRGVTAPGVPVIGIGHNADVAWGFTSGLSDEDDLYAERLVPGDPEAYRFMGEVRHMTCRDETFTYRSAPTDLLGGKPPESGTKTERVCRTLHGPVQERDGDVAYARRYAIWGRELETLTGIADLNSARDIHDVDRAMREVTWNENVMAADSHGNIGYWHPGLFPGRPRGWDERLPYPGTGEAEWPGLVDRAKLPHVINPRQGWLANWNNIPSQGWTSGDGVATERVTGQFHRVAWLMRLVRRMAKAPSFAAADNVVRQEGSTAQQRPLARTRLLRAARGATGHEAAVLRAILAWDGDYTRTDDRGTVDPGVAAWQAFKAQAAQVACAPFGTAWKRFGERTSTSHVFDITDPQAFALRTLSPAGYRLAARRAFDDLAKQFGSDDPAAWRAKRAMYDVSAQGAGQAPPLPFFDRGTWEQIVELGP
jgi:acyl-homoserine lactone acylase PvdQ